ncbi:hypothetical protein [Geodermatophilus sp. URMC 64]
MKTVIPDAQIDRLTVGRISVGQLDAGPVRVGRLVLNDARTSVRTGTAAFRNLRVELQLELRLRWTVSVDLGFLEKTWDGTIELGVQKPTIRVGDLTLPGLQRLDLTLASVAVEDLRADVGVLQNLTLGGATAEQVRIRDLTAPLQDVTLTGLGLGGISLEGLGLPAAAAGATTIARLVGEALPLGTITVPAVDLPAAGAGRVIAGGLDTTAVSNPIDFTADTGLLDVTLEVVPASRLLADELLLDGVEVALGIGSVELHDVVLPYQLLDLTLSDIGVQTVDVPKIQVA